MLSAALSHIFLLEKNPLLRRSQPPGKVKNENANELGTCMGIFGQKRKEAITIKKGRRIKSYKDNGAETMVAEDNVPSTALVCLSWQKITERV